jgi:hypothetical protein
VLFDAASERQSALQRIETIGHRWVKISELNDTNETISNFVAECAPPRACGQQGGSEANGGAGGGYAGHLCYRYGGNQIWYVIAIIASLAISAASIYIAMHK